MIASFSFNTQPPEGGWSPSVLKVDGLTCFNTQPPEGGWVCDLVVRRVFIQVSTHSRLKAAGPIDINHHTR